MMGVSSMFAYNVGDYIYTRTGRFSIIGENLLTNGDFKAGLATGDVTDVKNAVLSEDIWQWYENGGPNDMPYIKVIEGNTGKALADGIDATATSTNLYAHAMREGNANYVLTFKAKTTVEGGAYQTSNTPNGGRNGNYISFYADENGEYATPGSKNVINQCFDYINDEWKEYTYYFQSTDAGFLNILFANLQADLCFADFGIYKVESAVDDRRAYEIKEEMEFYLANEELFPNNRAALQRQLDRLSGMIENDEISEQYLASFDEDNNPISSFLDANSVDVSSYFKNFHDGGSGWTANGDRWGTEGANDIFATQHVRRDINNMYGWGDGTYTQTVDLPAGQYLYIVRAQAYHYEKDGRGSKNNNTIPIYGGQFMTGLRAFLNTDSINMDDVSTDRSTLYRKVLAAEDGPKTIGFFSPAVTWGGHINFDNVQFRLMGKDQAFVDNYFWGKKCAEATNALTVMRDSAQHVYDSNRYIFGKAVLKDSIDISTAVLAANTEISEACYNALTTQVGYMRSAINAYYTLNAEYTTLGDDIAKCNGEVNDATRPKGQDVFKAAITTAEGVYNAVNAANRDSVALANADVALMAARMTFFLDNATYKTPAEIDLINNSFQMRNATGWEVDNGGDDGRAKWSYNANAAISEGYSIYYNRGDVANDVKYVYQPVPVTRNGVYEFTAEAAVHNSKNSTVQPTGVFLLAGTDSVEVCTPGVGTGGQNIGQYGKFAVKSVVDDAKMAQIENTLNVGLAKPTNAYSVNIMVMGACHLKYYGPYDQYKADSTAAVLKPTKDSLMVAVNAAQALLDESRNPNGVDTTPFSTAISTARGVCNNNAATLDEVLAQFDLLAAATETFTFSGVYPAKGKYYDHSKLLVNPLFNAAGENMLEGWTVVTDGDKTIENAKNEWAALNLVEGYVTGQFFANYGQGHNATLTQEVTGMVDGVYSFAANATYMNKFNYTDQWPADLYEAPNTFAAITLNSDSTFFAGLVTEGVTVNGATLEYADGKTLSLYQARHFGDANGAPFVANVLSAGHYATEVASKVSGGKGTVGFAAVNIADGSVIYAYMPQLRFWGDEYVNGIENVVVTDVNNNANTGDVYTMSGVKVRANATSLKGLPKGMYIMNGKKFIVK